MTQTYASLAARRGAAGGMQASATQTQAQASTQLATEAEQSGTWYNHALSHTGLITHSAPHPKACFRAY